MSENSYDSLISHHSLDSSQDMIDELNEINHTTIFFCNALIHYMYNTEEWLSTGKQDPHIHGACCVLDFLDFKMRRLSDALEKINITEQD